VALTTRSLVIAQQGVLLVYAQRAKLPLQALPCSLDGRDLENHSLTSGGQTATLVKTLSNNVLIIFDELSNAVCPSSLALLVTKIAGKSVTVRPILSAEANFKVKSPGLKINRF
jgi:hypothetical protein